MILSNPQKNTSIQSYTFPETKVYQNQKQKKILKKWIRHWFPKDSWLGCGRLSQWQYHRKKSYHTNRLQAMCNSEPQMTIFYHAILDLAWRKIIGVDWIMRVAVLASMNVTNNLLKTQSHRRWDRKSDLNLKSTEPTKREKTGTRIRTWCWVMWAACTTQQLHILHNESTLHNQPTRNEVHVYKKHEETSGLQHSSNKHFLFFVNLEITPSSPHMCIKVSNYVFIQEPLVSFHTKNETEIKTRRLQRLWTHQTFIQRTKISSCY